MEKELIFDFKYLDIAKVYLVRNDVDIIDDKSNKKVRYTVNIKVKGKDKRWNSWVALRGDYIYKNNAITHYNELISNLMLILKGDLEWNSKIEDISAWRHIQKIILKEEK